MSNLDLTGTLLDGRYRLGELLGSGGMSAVFEAEDTRLLRTVAIKVLLRSRSRVLAERLFREAQAAARADHPAVITVYGYGTDNDLELDYLVLERLRGEDLATRIRSRGTLGIEHVFRIGIEVADALAAIHDAGVVHRDLKPANIYLARRGRRVDEVRLLDFGTAKQLDLKTLTGPGQILGTLAYMPPEQLRDSKRVDARVDVYSLGVSLYECVSGRLPYSFQPTSELAAAIILGVVETLPLAELAPAAPPLLVDIIECCLQRQPEHRFASARAVQNALRGARRAWRG